MKSRKTMLLRRLVSCAAMLFVSQLHAGGFYVSELGTPGSLGTGGAANTTNNIGADASFTNPAGMTGLMSDEILSGIQLIAPVAEFDSAEYIRHSPE